MRSFWHLVLGLLIVAGLLGLARLAGPAGPLGPGPHAEAGANQTLDTGTPTGTSTGTATAPPAGTDTPTTVPPGGTITSTALPPTGTNTAIAASPTATATPLPTQTATSTPTPTATPAQNSCLDGWQQVAVPNAYALVAVAASSDSNVWSVGGNMALQWDGVTWTARTVPSPNGQPVHLSGVATSGPGNVWVVGSYSRNGGSASNAVVAHWDGHTWAILCCGDPLEAAAPHGGGLPYAQFTLAFLQNANQVAVYGEYFIDFPPPYYHDYNSVCSATSCTSPYPGAADIFWNGAGSVGNGQTWLAGSALDEANGTNHSQVNGQIITPDIGALGGVSGWTPSDVWTFGGAQILHWNGHAWSLSYTATGHSLAGIVGLAANNAWAVGDTILHWNGQTWSEIPHLAVTLAALAAPAVGSIWAVGHDPQYQGVVEHYTGTCPPESPTPVRPTATRTPLPPTATPCPLGAFSDVHPSDYFYTAVTYLATHYVLGGYGDCTFRPYNQTTRGQMVKIVVTGFGKPLTTPARGYRFADVPPAHPFYAYIETAAALTIVSGYACGGVGEPCDPAHRPYFRPYANVTRGQLSKITVVAAGWALLNPPAASFPDVLPGTAFYPFVETAAAHGIISGYVCGGSGEPCDPGNRDYFRPSHNAIRAQVAKLVYLAVTAPTPTPTPPPAASPTP